MRSGATRSWLRERSTAVLDEVLGALVLAVCVFLVGRGAAGVAAIPAVLGVVAVHTAVRVHRVSRRPDRRVVVLGELKRPDYTRLAISQLTRPDPLVADRVHAFTLIDQEFVIEGVDVRWTFTYEGRNSAAHPSRMFRDVMTGDSQGDLQLMEIRAVDLLHGQPMDWSAVSDEPYRKVLDFHFPRPVLPGEEFRIQLSCRWRGTFTTIESYVFFSFGLRRRGTERFRGTIVVPGIPDYVEGVRYDGRVITTEIDQPRVTSEDGRTTIVWEVENPLAEPRGVYAVDFKRTDLRPSPGHGRVPPDALVG